MTDSQRFERLVKQFDTLQFRDTAIINRVDFDFVLGSYNKYLKVKEENRELKMKIKLLEMRGRG
jgi:SMC interacting uncharacterized protein involved in chromosome segregation